MRDSPRFHLNPGEHTISLINKPVPGNCAMWIRLNDGRYVYILFNGEWHITAKDYFSRDHSGFPSGEWLQP